MILGCHFAADCINYKSANEKYQDKIQEVAVACFKEVIQ